jgi:hypothetical protein
MHYTYMHAYTQGTTPLLRVMGVRTYMHTYIDTCMHAHTYMHAYTQGTTPLLRVMGVRTGISIEDENEVCMYACNVCMYVFMYAMYQY